MTMKRTPPEILILESLQTALTAIDGNEDWHTDFGGRVYLNEAPSEHTPAAPYIEIGNDAQPITGEQTGLEQVLEVPIVCTLPVALTGSYALGWQAIEDVRKAVREWKCRTYMPAISRIDAATATVPPRVSGESYLSVIYELSITLEVI